MRSRKPRRAEMPCKNDSDNRRSTAGFIKIGSRNTWVCTAVSFLLLCFVITINRTQSEISRAVAKEDVVHQLNGIPNYNEDRFFTFHFSEADTRNSSLLLFKIVEFCLLNEMGSTMYQNIFNRVIELHSKDSPDVNISFFDSISNETKDEVIHKLQQKYAHKIGYGKDKEMRVLEGTPKRSVYLRRLCGWLGDLYTYEHHSTIKSNSLQSVRELLPYLLARVNMEVNANFELADYSIKNPHISLKSYWDDFLASSLSHELGLEHDWVDENLCIKVMLNRSIDDEAAPYPQSMHKRQCRGSFESFTYSPLSYFFTYRLQSSYRLKYVASETSSSSYENLINSSKGSMMVTQDHFSSKISLPGTKPLIAVSAYDYYITDNLTHLFEAFQLAWSFIAFLKKEGSWKEHKYQYAIVVPFDRDLRSIPSAALRGFVHLMLATIARVATNLDVLIFVKDVDLVLDFMRHNGSSGSAFGNLPDSNLSVFRSYENVVFRILIERPVVHSLTHDGLAEMAREMLQQCDGAQPVQMDAKTSSSSPYLELASPDQSASSCSTGATEGGAPGATPGENRCAGRYSNSVPMPAASTPSTLASLETQEQPVSSGQIVLAARRGNRFITNLEEVVQSIESAFQRPVQVVYFGDLAPCEQIKLARNTSLLVFVHGADGRMMSFMRPGTLAVELWPGCRAANDFYMYYKVFFPSIAEAAGVHHAYFSGTFASTTVCEGWEYRMRIAYGCGLTVVIDMLDAFLVKLAKLRLI